MPCENTADQRDCALCLRWRPAPVLDTVCAREIDGTASRKVLDTADPRHLLQTAASKPGLLFHVLNFFT